MHYYCSTDRLMFLNNLSPNFLFYLSFKWYKHTVIFITISIIVWIYALEHLVACTLWGAGKVQKYAVMQSSNRGGLVPHLTWVLVAQKARAPIEVEFN